MCILHTSWLESGFPPDPKLMIKMCPEAPGLVAPVILILACVSAHAILFHVNA